MEGVREWVPKRRPEIVQEEREEVGGTMKTVQVRRRMWLSEEERQQRARSALETLNWRPPSVATYAAWNAYFGPSGSDQQKFKQAIKDVLEGLDNGDPEPFFTALG